MTPKISIVGLGKLGASMMAGMASRGFEVVGVDINQRAVELINQGKAPVEETQLSEMLELYKARISATTSYAEAINASHVSFIIVPTPSLENGAFSNDYVCLALDEIGHALRNKSDYHLIVITSTVLPGSTRHILIPKIESASGKKCGVDFGICYSPEFIALGTVIRDFLNPDFYLIGEFDKRSGDLLEEVNKKVAINHAPSKRMSIENAELSKIAINSYVTLKISFANMISEICGSLPSGDIDVVSDALGMDSRIGRKYLSGGLGYGGPCFPRDNLALSFVGEKLGGDLELALTNHRFNKTIATRILNKIKTQFKPTSRVAVLGLAYKPQSHVIEESPGIQISEILASMGFKVSGYDPLANQAARERLGNSVNIVDDLNYCLKNSDIILITTADPIFQNITAEEILDKTSSVTVVDFWRILRTEFSGKKGINYIPIGVCTDGDVAVKNLNKLWAVV
jgi:UDPglucose 6-dehydrogenase